MWNYEKSLIAAAREIASKMKRDPGFAPAFTVYQSGFRAANPAGHTATNVFSQYGLETNGEFNAAVLHLFRHTAKETGRPVEAKIIRRGQKPKVKPVVDPKAFWQNLLPYGVAQVVMSVPRRDGRSPHARGQAKPR